jgi:hypothetical protein
MKKILLSISVLFLLSSCSSKYTPPSSAMINVTNYKIGDVSLLKTGKACYSTFFGIPYEKSSSVIDAMRNGNISTIKMIDKEFTYAFVVNKYCTIVHGL